MATDQQVSAQAVLRALMRLRRLGADQTLKELETLEPDLANYVMEEFSLVHRDVLALGGPPRRSRQLQRRLEHLVLACITAMREAHYQLWQASVADSPLARLQACEDGTPAGEEPSDPPGGP